MGCDIAEECSRFLIVAREEGTTNKVTTTVVVGIPVASGYPGL